MNRVIVITGANNGIGLSLTRSLMKMKDCVVALDLCVDNLDPTHSHLIPRECDVTNPENIQLVIDEAMQLCGHVDVLINDACLALFSPFDRFDGNRFDPGCL